MKRYIVLLTLSAMVNQSFGFCGFYVAKAGASLFNNKSEVILVRDGTKTIITMSNDFKGNVKDFAMVVPVPEILRERDIKVVDRSIFDKLDAYSAPRLVEYYDANPCWSDKLYEYDMAPVSGSRATKAEDKDVVMNKSLGVTIEAKYTIGEYDILILSATESKGLKTWLTDNGYTIPENASEVLDPYIKSDLKFFVVKVNLEASKNTGYNYLRPIQITFNSDRFMLPIRLGMANAVSAQDLIIYAFTRTGRVETTNYRTVKMPTDRNVPTFVLNEFEPFYQKTFDKAYHSEGENAVFLEYAWNVTPSYGQVKCDPCVGPPPIEGDLREAGVDWFSAASSGKVFFTRLHVRYTRNQFPQDLMFQATPNNEIYQARYIVTHPATDVNCEEGKKYLAQLEMRKIRELHEFAALTGNSLQSYQWYAPALKNEGNKSGKNDVFPVYGDNGNQSGPRSPGILFLLIIPMLLLGFGMLLARLRSR